MNGSKNSLYQQDAAELFSMLESQDLKIVEEVKCLLQENLNSAKGIGLLNGLLDYYMNVQSMRALDILVHVREPLHKYLFDKMTEYLKRENTRYQCLLLLSHMIHHQPPWLFKITQHRIFHTLLHLLKTETEPSSLMCSLLSIVSLLPMIPYQIGSYLEDIFEIFSHLAAWSSKIQSGIPEVYILHLQVGIYVLFHRLYGMFPCNFLGYLRAYYGGREYREENIKVFNTTIRPMLERVRLHPSLVTACKDSEVSQKRWKKLATHDIVSLCTSVSLDPVEGTSEKSSNKISNHSVIIPRFSPVQSQGADVVIDDFSSNQSEILWSPSQTSGFSTPPTFTEQLDFLGKSSELHTVDSLPGIDNFGSDNNTLPLRDLENVDTSLETSYNENIGTVDETFETREEDFDEISELACERPVFFDYDISHNTPFQCTTQNLTDKTDFISHTFKASEKRFHNDIWKENLFSNQEELKREKFVRTMNKLRYFSQCSLPSDNETMLTRSLPNIFIGEVFASPLEVSKIHVDDLETVIAEDTDISNSFSQNFEADCICSQSTHSVETSYDHLMPLVLQTSSEIYPNDTAGHSSSSNITEVGSLYCSLSPTELLDRYLQLGCDVKIRQLGSIPLTSTKHASWTHFGGIPPVDAVDLARTQVQLLHAQVLFERHRREIHAERNRRLLGKTKHSRIQEEITTALKDQVSLLKVDNAVIQRELNHQNELNYELGLKSQETEIDFKLNMLKLTQENSNLQYSNKKLQGLLVSQKQENDTLQEELKHSKFQVLNLEFELELLKAEAERSKKLEKENLLLAKENTVLQEMAHQYHEKFPTSEKSKLSAVENDLIGDSAIMEIKTLKQALESKCIIIDNLKARISSLDEETADMKSKFLYQCQLNKDLKAIHKDEIRAREERLLELKKILNYDMAHILELHCMKENLTSKLGLFHADPQGLHSDDKSSSCTQLFLANEDYEVPYFDELNINLTDRSIVSPTSENNVSCCDSSCESSNLDIS